MEQQTVGYWANIPAEVRYDDRIPANAKLLYGEIEALKRKEGYCFASNQYFATLYKTTERNIRRLLQALSENGYLEIRNVVDADGKVSGRHIYTIIPSPQLLPDETCDDSRTKMSGGRTKMSEKPDKNVRYNKNNINKTYTPLPPKAKKSEAALPELMTWAAEIAPECAELQERLQDFCKARSKPLTSGRAVKLLTNKLVKLSDGKVDVMLAMLDKAILHNWESVYALKPDEMPTISAPPSEEAVPWV